MREIILSGCGGRLGSAVVRLAAESDDCAVAAGIDPVLQSGLTAHFPFPVAASPDELDGMKLPDAVIVDCSHHTAAPPLCAFAVRHRYPLVVATTGHDSAELDAIRAASLHVPVFHSRNMSLGVNLLTALVERAAAALAGKGFDIEIIEYHHRRKLDAPSGTALMLADAAVRALDDDGVSADGLPPRETEYVCDRSKRSSARPEGEIGISSVRGGTIVGRHDVLFAGEAETLTLSHEAGSRDVFASGTLAAVRYIADKPAGMYDMRRLVDETDLLK